MKRTEAIKAGSMFYTGKICERHPELKGQRRVKSRNCHKCIVDRMRRTAREKRRTKPYVRGPYRKAGKSNRVGAARV
jgi:hypothetical protein